MLKTNVDAMLEMLDSDKPVSIAEISKRLGTKEAIVEKIAKYLEEDGMLKIQYKFIVPYLVLQKTVDNLNIKKEEIQQNEKTTKTSIKNLFLDKLFHKKPKPEQKEDKITEPDYDKTKQIERAKIEQKEGKKAKEIKDSKAKKLEAEKKPEDEAVKNLVKIMDQIKISIKKGDIIGACDLYVKAVETYGKIKDSESKGDLYKQLDGIYKILSAK